MRFRSFVPLILVLLVGLACWLFLSDAQSPEPRSLLARAIEAHGGAKKIGKPRRGMLKGKTEGKGAEASQEEISDLPRRWKRVTSAIVDGKRRVAFDLMIDGKLWQWDEGTAPQEVPNQANAQPYFASVSLLLDLTRDNVRLSRIQKTKVNGESTAGFRATWDNSAADYFFDDRTGLLVQSRFAFQFEPGKNHETQTVYGDYREEDGVKLPLRRTTFVKGGEFRDFVLMTDYVVTEVKVLDTVENEAFALPAKK